MEREEVKKILTIIDATYPNFNPTNLGDTLSAWEFALDGYTYSQISVALKNYMQSDVSGFAPTPGQLINGVHIPSDYGDINEQEASTLVVKALRNSTYNAEKEFDKLPKSVQRAVGSASQLRLWAMDEKFNLEVVQSNIQRAFRNEKIQEQNFRRMSPEMQTMIGEQMKSKVMIDAPRTENKFLIETEIDNAEVLTPEKSQEYMQRLKERLGYGN